MPNKWTFKIPSIRKLVYRYVGDGIGWADPFSGENSPAELTNDLNPDRPAKYHMKASEFADIVPSGLKGVLFDPPYSNRQIKECYESIGIPFTQEDSQALFQYEKKLFAGKVLTGGIVISFGWNSGGFGKGLGFEIVEILLVAHGGSHNDTIVTVERKFLTDLFSP